VTFGYFVGLHSLAIRCALSDLNGRHLGGARCGGRVKVFDLLD
jgi:hypothetical protein